MLKVLEYILMTWPASEPEFRDYNECIKELQSESTIELQRLALEMPDHLLVSWHLVVFVEGSRNINVANRCHVERL